MLFCLEEFSWVFVFLVGWYNILLWGWGCTFWCLVGGWFRRVFLPLGGWAVPLVCFAWGGFSGVCGFCRLMWYVFVACWIWRRRYFGYLARICMCLFGRRAWVVLDFGVL